MAQGKAGAAAAIAAAERRRKALGLRRGGASLRDIAAALGCSHEQARRDVAAALAELAADTRAEAEQLRALEVARLDAVMLGHWSAATKGDADAARIVLRCVEQRVKLLGLAVQSDAPNLGELLEIVLRWSDGRIIDVTPHAHDHASAPPPLPGDGSRAPGPVQGAGGGEAVGEVAISWGVIPGDSGTKG